MIARLGQSAIRLIAAGLIGTAIGAAGIWVFLEQRAQREQLYAQTGTLTDAGDKALSAGEPMLALRYALAVLDSSPTEAITDAHRIGAERTMTDALKKLPRLTFGRFETYAVSPDGRYSLGNWGATIRVFEAETLAPGKTLGPASILQRAGFEASGRVAYTFGSDGTASLWLTDVWEAASRVTSGRSWGNVVRMPNTPAPRMALVPITSVDVSADGAVFATAAGLDNGASVPDKLGFVSLWSGETGQKLTEFNTEHGYVHSVRFSRDSKTILTGSADGIARLWTQDGKRVLTALPSIETAVRQAEFSYDGRFVAAAGYDRVILFRLAPKPIEVLRDGHNGMERLVFSDDGRSFATAGDDGRVSLWTILPMVKRRWQTPVGAPVRALAISTDGMWLAALAEDGYVRLLDMASGREVERMSIPGAVPPSALLSFLDNTTLLASTSGTTLVWHIGSRIDADDILTRTDRADRIKAAAALSLGHARSSMLDLAAKIPQ